MRRFSPSWGVLWAALGLFAMQANAQRPQVSLEEGIFDNKTVLRVRIELGTNEVESLRREPRWYVSARVVEGSNLWGHVGLRLKGGSGSFRPLADKPSLTLSFNRFTQEGRFYGLKKIHLNNSVQDGSYLTENICGEMYRRAGIPTPRVSYATVSINGKDKGLYVVKEGFTKQFLGMYFTNRDGNLYDGGFVREITDPLDRDTESKDVNDWSDLRALAAAAREPDLGKRFGRMSQVLDMDRFLSFLALEIMTWNWDGYVMNRNNYRIYHNLDSGKLVFLPHGMDQMFWEVNQRIIPQPDRFNALVAKALMETEEGKEAYLRRFKSLYTNVFHLGLISNQVHSLSTLLQSHAGPDYSNHVRRIRFLIFAQHLNLANQLGQADR